MVVSIVFSWTDKTGCWTIFTDFLHCNNEQWVVDPADCSEVKTHLTSKVKTIISDMLY